MDGLDLTTLFVASAVHHLVILAVVVPFWLKQHRRYQGLDLWMAGYLVLAVGQLVLMGQQVIHPLLSIVTANVMIIGGSLLYLAGLEKFVNKCWYQLHNILLLAVVTGLFICFTFLVDSLSARTIIASVAHAAVSFQCAFLLFKRVDRHLRRITLIPAVVLTLYCAAAVSRIIFLVFIPGTGDFLQTQGADIIHLMIFEILGTALLISTVLMISGRLCAELETIDKKREGKLHELEHLAMEDNLTGVYNRLKLERLLEEEIKRSHRYGRPLSVIMVDVDHYKLINDSFGHDVGDTVLKAITQELLHNIRQVDMVGRWGGDEFLIISPETVLFGAANLAENLRKKIEKYKFKQTGNQTVSFGVAELKHEEHMEGLLKRADDSLYRAKQFGRNKVMWAGKG